MKIRILCFHLRQILLATCALLIFPALNSFAGTNQWTTSGPDSAPIFSFAINPTSSSTMYAGTTRGVYKTANGGTSWSFSSTGLDTGSHSNGYMVAINPQTPTTIYAGFPGKGIYKSTNSGASWTLAGSPNFRYSNLVVDYQNPATLYFGCSTGGESVCKSTDGGATSTSVAVGGEVRDLAIDPLSPGVLYGLIYVSSTRTSKIIKSTNSGQSWFETGTGLPGGNTWNTRYYHGLVINPQNPSILYAGFFEGVYKSTDSGSSWTRLTNAGVRNHVLAIHPQNPSIVYEGSEFGVKKTADSGSTWTDLQSPGDGNPPEVGADIQALAIDPQTPATVYAGSGDGNGYWASHYGVMKSTDNGSHWTKINSGLREAYIGSVAINPQTPSTVYVSGQGMYKSTNGGTSWSELGSGGSVSPTYRSVALSKLNPSTLYRYNYYSVLKSTDGGATWQYISLPFYISNIVVDHQNANIVYAAVAEGSDTPGVYKSTDGCATWSQLSLGTLFSVDKIVMDPQNSAVIYAAACDTNGYYGVYRSTTSGSSWSKVKSTSQYINDIAVHPTDSTKVYAAFGDGIWKSSDGGTTWTSSWDGNYANLHSGEFAIDPQAADTLYVISNSDGIYRSTDGGTHWGALASGLPYNYDIHGIAVDGLSPPTIHVGTKQYGVLSWTMSSAPAVSMSPAFHTFGSILRLSSSSARTFTLRNNGTASLTVSSISLAGTAPGQYILNSGTCGSAPTLAAGGSCTLSVTFAPTATGAQNAVVRIASNDPFIPTLDIALSGTGQPRDFSLSLSITGAGSGTVQSSPSPSINCSSGTCSQNQTEDTVVSLSAAPNLGSLFSGWGGACSGTGLCSVTMTAAKSVTATFSVNSNPGGWVVQVPQTGAATSYEQGDDGDILSGVAWPSPRFTIVGDGTVHDKLTGLLWARDASTPTAAECSGGSKNWQGALDYVACLNGVAYLGYSDWVLPNIAELKSIYNPMLPNPALPANHPFTGIQPWYWSSTGSTNYSGYARCSSIGDMSDCYKSDALFVLPVRTTRSSAAIDLPKTGQATSSGPGDDGATQRGVAWPTPRFTDNGNGTVTDNLTKLVWLRDANCFGPRNWSGAVSAANQLANGGCNLTDGSVAGRWRLPNVVEMASLVDHGRTGPALGSGHPFTNVQTGTSYWSSTVNTTADYSWLFNMGTGESTLLDRTEERLVWLVRNDQPLSGSFPLTVTTSGNGTGTVTSNPGTLTWAGGTGTGSYATPTTVTLTPVDDAGSSFTGWSGACSGTGSCTVLMNRARSVTATFTRTGIVQTGQTTCYADTGTGGFVTGACSGTGQDGELQAGSPWPVPRFTDNGNDTVTDTLTGLTWTKDATSAGSCGSGSRNWSDALGYVQCLNSNFHLGYSDWRLPNLNELASLLNHGDSGVAWYGFTNVGNGSWWSSSTVAGNTGSAYTVDFENRTSGSAYKYDNGYVWAVRSGGTGQIVLPKTGQTTSYATGDDGDLQSGAGWSAARITVNGNQTITDNLSGLTWIRDANAPGPAACSPGTAKTWSEALNYIGCLNANIYLGFNDWRLPNINEMSGFRNLEAYDQAAWLTDAGVAGLQGPAYWTSTTSATDAGYAWAVNLSSSTAAPYSGKTNLNSIWPVRGGQAQPHGAIIVTITTVGTGSGQATTSSGTIVWNGTTGTATSTPPGALTITAVPDSGSGFFGWNSVVCGTGPGGPAIGPCTVYTSTSIEANFEAGMQLLSFQGIGAGMVYIGIDPQGYIPSGIPFPIGVPAGTVVTLKASAAVGHRFAGWSGACSGTGTCQITMDQAKAVTATFTYTGATSVTGTIYSSNGANSVDWAGQYGYLQGPGYIRIAGTYYYVTTTMASSWSGPQYVYGTLQNCDQYTGEPYWWYDNPSVAGQSFQLYNTWPGNMLDAKVGESYFWSLANAFNALSDNGLLQARVFDFYEDLLFDRPISFTLKGGYDSGYSANGGATTIHGSITIAAGTVNADKITIMP